jgi:hypothetical protein
MSERIPEIFQIGLVGFKALLNKKAGLSNRIIPD